MRSFFYALLTVVIVITALIIVVNWNSIMGWWNRPKEGDKCILATEPSYQEGVIKNGQCISQNTTEIPDNSGNSNTSGIPPSADDLQVSNPNGAFMYYQSLSQASQGLIYGKSNVLIPYGTKLKLVKTWQTNLSTQPYSGFYETTYKQYGPGSGFFATADVMKIQ